MSEVLLHPDIGTASIVAVLGYAVVFFGLVLLLIVIAVMGKIMVASQRKAAAKAAAEAAAAPVSEAAPLAEAKGTAGELKLHDVDPRDAAIIMAIVAHQLQKPLNELRFRSIKEVKE